MHHELAAGTRIGGEELHPIGIDPVIGQSADAVRPAGLREMKHRQHNRQRDGKCQHQYAQADGQDERKPTRPLLSDGRDQQRASPRVIRAEAPQVSFQVVAAKAATAVVFIPDLHGDAGAARLGAGIDGVSIGDDDISRLS